ncbi:MAG: NADH-quinone oxidoreductase subunit NuoK [Myxococcales bacterium]|nr:NADH-quinone oxidoreductase subunit NuoK [Myxococcales bacterium]
MPLSWWLTLGTVLFGVGTIGVLTRRNALVVFMSIELMLNAVNLILLAFARQRGDEHGHVLAFFIIAVAAAEAAVGLAIILSVFRHKRSVNLDDVRALKH